MAFEHRVKLFISENHRLIVAALVLVGVLCLVGAGYVFSTPTTQTITEETDRQTFETRADPSALVTRQTALYEQGERLDNRSVYFLSASPSMTFDVETTVPADVPVRLNHRLELEIRGVRDGQEFYRSTETLLEANETVTDGQFTASETVNVSALRGELQTLRASTEGVGEFEIRLSQTVQYETESYEGTLVSTVPFVIDGRSYYLEETVEAEQVESMSVQRQVTEPPNPLEYGGFALVGLLLLGVAVLARDLDDRIDTEELRTRIVHDRHDEWISRGEFPTNSQKQYISILTLEDLVDVAIDTNRRVIHDPQIDAYAVIDSSEIYYYAIEEVAADEWLDI
ncbi:DUF5305 family protein [Halobellus salinisoli]|uniref:DUF5305 family protein n=1 Tax=Halobellus salinisoli TaxID=3108500 RepID=UPI00300A7173